MSHLTQRRSFQRKTQTTTTQICVIKKSQNALAKKIKSKTEPTQQCTIVRNCGTKYSIEQTVPTIFLLVFQRVIIAQMVSIADIIHTEISTRWKANASQQSINSNKRASHNKHSKSREDLNNEIASVQKYASDGGRFVMRVARICSWVLRKDAESVGNGDRVSLCNLHGVRGALWDPP